MKAVDDDNSGGGSEVLNPSNAAVSKLFNPLVDNINPLPPSTATTTTTTTAVDEKNNKNNNNNNSNKKKNTSTAAATALLSRYWSPDRFHLSPDGYDLLGTVLVRTQVLIVLSS